MPNTLDDLHHSIIAHAQDTGLTVEQVTAKAVEAGLVALKLMKVKKNG